MKYDTLPEEILKIIKEPFVFVSYSHTNKNVYDRVQELVQYLRSKNIPVVYDEGGLEPGVELTQFENLILDKNCTYVLVVFDEGYVKKTEMKTGGAWREYFNISNDYPNNRMKYIPLKVDSNIPALFQGKVYIDFDTNNNETLEKIESAVARVKKVKKISNTNVEILMKEASELCDSDAYKVANRKIDEAIYVYGKQKKTKLCKWAELYNLKLFICIKLCDTDSAVKVAGQLQMIVSNRLDYEKKALYYTNCALAYRMRNKSSDEYVECAKKAYVAAMKGGIEELYYYACMFATALYEAEQFVSAYKIIKEAYDLFISAKSDISKYSKGDYIMLTQIKGNVAEIAVACGEHMNNGHKRKLEYLMEAKKNIIDILQFKGLEDEDAICAEMYSIAAIVFEALKRYYLVKH